MFDGRDRGTAKSARLFVDCCGSHIYRIMPYEKPMHMAYLTSLSTKYETIIAKDYIFWNSSHLKALTVGTKFYALYCSKHAMLQPSRINPLRHEQLVDSHEVSHMERAMTQLRKLLAAMAQSIKSNLVELSR